MNTLQKAITNYKTAKCIITKQKTFIKTLHTLQRTMIRFNNIKYTTKTLKLIKHAKYTAKKTMNIIKTKIRTEQGRPA